MTLCGIFNIDKPRGPTSREIVDHVVKLVRPAKAGHAGTLDPLATGILVVCVGHATRLINLIQEGRKRYRGRFVLGLRSDTDDITGNVVADGNYEHVTEPLVMSLLPDLTGRIQQVPPQFSAVHVEGQRAYDLARRGEFVELESRSVDVFSIQLTMFQPPEFELEIECGSGTYIRSIGRDLGQKLGCGAVMSELRRLAVGPFDLTNAVTPDRLTAGSLNQYLQSPLVAVNDLPKRLLSDDEVIAIRRGQKIAANVDALQHQSGKTAVDQYLQHDDRVACINPAGCLIGVGMIDQTTGRIQPRIVFPTD